MASRQKIYPLTKAGRAEFAQQLAMPLSEDMFRSPFLPFARFAYILPRDLVETRFNEFLQQTIDKRKHLEEAAEERCSNASDTWVINYGRAIMEIPEQNLRTHMHELITLARAEPEKDAAE
ncbi:MAG: hypothetical protein MO846_01905 [Candidatus Devosia symbiotica]|nr:hypothetical protein [Candidatus Devosia symbiotica]